MQFPAPVASAAARLVAAWERRAVSLKAISFALVGLVNTAVDAIVFFVMFVYVTSSWAFAEFVTSLAIAIDPYVTTAFTAFLTKNASLIVANVVSWFVAVTGSYVMNSFTTFSAETGRKLRLKDYAGFVGSGVVAVIATTTTVVIAANFMPVWAAKGVSILVSFAVNFSITHFVVFRPKREPANGAR